MKKITLILFVVCIGLSLSLTAQGQDKAANKYVGVKTCSPCHKADKTGNQFGVWTKSKHSEAFKVLTTDQAAAVAKKKGLTKPASESPECLTCHTPVTDASVMEKTYDTKDGVQCEVCHGAGSGYKTMSIMKDKPKAIAAGLAEFKDDAAIEAKCKTCHNEKSPTYKPFNFKEMWPKIKHAVPKS